MTQCKWGVVGVLLLMTGCTETVESVTREYRNTINEGVDATMMIRDENSAIVMRSRVFNNLGSRFKDIDGHLQIVKDNRTNLEFVKEVCTSNGFQIYYSELPINMKRLMTEIARIEDVAANYVKKKRDEDNDRASTDQEIRVKVCPALDKFVRNSDEKAKGEAPMELQTLFSQIKDPKLVQMFNGFETLRGVEKEFPALKKIFDERQKVIFGQRR